ncbi:Transposase [Ornithinimicrobium cerasi]|uniref:Transposase n=1 Tax=Ornithinimicrobium cerasi TaxID=2248773 RepID=A0A285VAM4_9MICO|nr:Transposase [Ornithinimicrobium cerasi]
MMRVGATMANRSRSVLRSGPLPAIDDDELAEATAVLDVFHVVALGTKCVDEVRRRVQYATTGHRGRKGDPLYGIQNILRAGQENVTDKQRAPTDRAFAAHETHDEVDLTWQCAQQLRSAYKHADETQGRQVAERIVATFPTCPTPENARPRADPAQVDGSVPGLLHHRRDEWRDRGDQWTGRAAPPPGSRVQEQVQLQAPHAAHRLRTQPMPPTATGKSR